MNRKGRGERAVYNVTASLLSQIVALVSGFILPHLIMRSFGSSYNGITSSVSQFLSVIALLRGGVGGATRVALYKSLALKDMKQVSATIKATELFMRKIALVFLGFILVFSCLYPFLVRKEFSWLFASSLVIIISISTFMQYYFGITYQFLLQADQRQYITTFVDIIAVVLNVLISVILIKAGVGIHGVKFGSALAFSVVPLFLYFYCRKHYEIDDSVEPDFRSISQRWDAFYHQLASFVHNNTDISLLTIFYSQKIISVYTTYYLVGNGVRKILLTISVGVEAAFGDIIARKEKEVLQDDVSIYETMIHILSCCVFGPALLLVTPFIKVYTRDVTDIVYSRYTFGYLVIITEMLFCLRSPYEAIINAAGHFKETKKYAFIEAGMNLAISLVLVWKYELIGVVLGTLISIMFRIIAYSLYSDKYIVHRSYWIAIKRFLTTAVTILLICTICSLIAKPDSLTYLSWILYAIPVTIISIFVTIIINLLFYRNVTLKTGKKINSIIITVTKRFSKTKRRIK